MQIFYTVEEGGFNQNFILPFGRLRLLWYLMKVKLDNGELVYDEYFGDVGLPVKFHSIKLLNGKRWDTINGWNQGLRHRYLVWKARRYQSRLRMALVTEYILGKHNKEINRYTKNILATINKYKMSYEIY